MPAPRTVPAHQHHHASVVGKVFHVLFPPALVASAGAGVLLQPYEHDREKPAEEQQD